MNKLIIIILLLINSFCFAKHKDSSNDQVYFLAITKAKFDYLTILSDNFCYMEFEDQARLFNVFIKKLYPQSNYFENWIVSYRKHAQNKEDIMELPAEDYQKYFRLYVILNKMRILEYKLRGE
jgi:hypothetical protein